MVGWLSMMMMHPIKVRSSQLTSLRQTHSPPPRTVVDVLSTVSWGGGSGSALDWGHSNKRCQKNTSLVICINNNNHNQPTTKDHNTINTTDLRHAPNSQQTHHNHNHNHNIGSLAYHCHHVVTVTD